MHSRFDHEFYKSEWQRVLPIGPDGIEPYVQTSRILRLPAQQPELRPLIGLLGTAAQQVIASARWAAMRVSKRPALLESAPRAQRQRRLWVACASGTSGSAPARRAATPVEGG